jgi:hypothetical protein
MIEALGRTHPRLPIIMLTVVQDHQVNGMRFEEAEPASRSSLRA